MLVVLVVFDLDLPLRRSFRVLWLTAVFVIKAGVLAVLVTLDVSGFHLVRARGGHAHASWMQIRCVAWADFIIGNPPIARLILWHLSASHDSNSASLRPEWTLRGGGVS
jgi:hypothetical protein